MTTKPRLIFVVCSAIFLAPLSFSQDQVTSINAFRLIDQGGTPSDWSHGHVFFSSTLTDLGAGNDSRGEPRYWLQQRRRSNALNSGYSNALVSSSRRTRLLNYHPEDRKVPQQAGEDSTTRAAWTHRKPLERDWTQAFQTGGTTYSFTSPTYPAKFSFSSADPTPNCTTDYVVFTLPTGGTISPGNFNIIAFNNLYVSAAGGSRFCSGTAPTAMFEYNASSAGGTLNGSPVLSLDGTLIAFVENTLPLLGGAVLHVLKWRSGDIQTVDLLFPAAFNLVALSNCATNGTVAPCEYNLQYTPSGSRKAATLSAPFIDYKTDTAYLTDDGGNVYAIAPVFSATAANPPAVLTGWPVNVGASLILTPPVYDGVSKNVFVASTTGTEFFIKTVGSITGTCATGTPPCIGSNTFAFTGGGSVQEAPVVDSGAGRVWIFGTQAGGTPGSYVVQTDTALSAASVAAAQIGTGTLNVIHPGAPDNNYFTSIATGKFYACGQNATGGAQLYAFGFSASGVMNVTPFAGSPLLLANSAGANAPCSGALTEGFNQSVAKDWLFAGVKSRCINTVGPTNGCVLAFDVTNAFPSSVSNQLAVVGGTSGIVVDNVTDVAGATITTDIYFMLLGAQNCLDYNGIAHTGTCSVSATQSGLQ